MKTNQARFFLPLNKPLSRLTFKHIGVLCLFLFASLPLSADIVTDYNRLAKAAHLVVDAHGKVLSSRQADQPFIPASTVKLITAFLSLEYWGEQHRFKTPVYYDNQSGVLWVRGAGDPFLVSEEISLIARGVTRAGVKKISAIGLQTDLFQSNLVVPGATTTDNPYDALPTPLAANFNTVNLQVNNGTVISAEPQTPLTPVAQQIGGDRKRDGIFRVNIGHSSKLAERYFAEVLAATLRARGVAVGNDVLWGRIPVPEPVYVHANSRTLGQIIQAMLKYSTNFIANQLILTLVAEHTGNSADFRQVEKYLAHHLRSNLGWTNYALKEGAGLSAENRITAQQLVQLLLRFNHWQHLLPEIAPGIVAKTGTLTGVKTLAGYASGVNAEVLPFAVLVNQDVEAGFPEKLIRVLVN